MQDSCIFDSVAVGFKVWPLGSFSIKRSIKEWDSAAEIVGAITAPTSFAYYVSFHLIYLIDALFHNCSAYPFAHAPSFFAATLPR
jgi:hypothetical protein